jgi:hypothetical protein
MDLTYQEILDQWNEYEDRIAQNILGHEGETTYEEVITRVITTLHTLSASSNKVPSFLRSVVLEREEEIKECLKEKEIIPSYPLLRYAGTSSGAYFSGCIIDAQVPAGVKQSILDLKGSYNFHYTKAAANKQEMEKQYASLHEESLYANAVGFHLSEDVEGWESSLTASHGKNISPIIYIPEGLTGDVALNLGVAIHTGNNLGVHFGRNTRTLSFAAKAQGNFEYAPLAGCYMPRKTSCLSCTLHVSNIMNRSQSYEDCLRRVYRAASLATLMLTTFLYDDTQHNQYFLTNTLRYRPLSISLTGVHGALIRCDVDYTSTDAIEMIAQMQAAATLGSLIASAQLMNIASKTYRIGCNTDAVRSLVDRCLDEIEGLFESAITTPIQQALETHGSLFHIQTTTLNWDPITSGLGRNATPGIDPLVSLDVPSFCEGKNPLQLVCVEMFDGKGQLTCDKERLRQQTAEHIDPEFQLQLFGKINKLCFGTPYKVISIPETTSVKQVADLLNTARDLQLRFVFFQKWKHLDDTTSDKQSPISCEDDMAILIDTEPTPKHEEKSISISPLDLNAKVYTVFESTFGLFDVVICLDSNEKPRKIIIDESDASVSSEHFSEIRSVVMLINIALKSESLSLGLFDVLIKTKGTRHYVYEDQNFSSVLQVFSYLLVITTIHTLRRPNGETSL